MKSPNDLSVLRHSAAHLLAQAVSELFPETLLTIGPATEDGFFYDFQPTTSFKESDLEKITTRMRELADLNLPITHEDISKETARKLYHNNPFKLELIEGIPGETVGLSRQGDFYDLCRGGHVSSTAQLKHFKLLSISGSYWRANRENAALQRIYGTAFFTAQELADYEKHQEELALYDHRRLGKQMDLFSFQEEGVGFPFFHPKGKKTINALMSYMRGLHTEFDFEEISTPTMLSVDLWKQSGHFDHYQENMYFCTIDEKCYAIKPMNCPGSILVYKSRPRSYRELPLRLAEFGHVHRHELSGALHGLLRVRAFTQDDAHIYCTIEQIEAEISRILSMIFKMLKKTGFENVKVFLSTKPDNAMGDDHTWEVAITGLKNALASAQIPFEIKEGDGAFYGPKIEIKIEDSMKRMWTCGTIQLDFVQPYNFDLSYVSSQGTKERPVIIHQAIYGSIERFLAILLEHYKGLLPFWLAPIQARVLTITDAQKEYAQTVYQALKNAGIRIELDASSDPLAGQIKNAQLDKIPWMLIVGKKEVEQKTVTLRNFDGTQEFGLTIDQLIQKADTIINS